MSKTKEPNWMLTDNYAVGIDPLNWKLYRRTMDHKTGKPKGWKVIGYYPRLRLLLTDLLDVHMLTDTDSKDIPERVDAAIKACDAAASALLRYMNAIGAGLDAYPPKYASFNIKEIAA